jgi:hypothetical protein
MSYRTEIASVLTTSFKLLFAPSLFHSRRQFDFSLPQKFGSRSQASRAFAAGQVKRQIKPEGHNQDRPLHLRCAPSSLP